MELLDSRVRGNHFAKAAVEFALFDLLGKSLGQPVYSLLGGAYRDRVPLSWPWPAAVWRKTWRKPGKR